MTAAPAFPTLQTARLLLREITPEDALALFEIHGDPAAMRYFGSLQKDLDGMRAVIQRFAQWRSLPAPGTRWGIALQAGGPLIGSCGLFSWNRESRRCALGYELHPTHQGQGLMQEALSAVLAWGFAQMDGLHRIEAQIHPDNLSSTRLIQRMGFRADGLQRDVIWYEDQPMSLTMWSRLKTDPTPALPPV